MHLLSLHQDFVPTALGLLPVAVAFLLVVTSRRFPVFRSFLAWGCSTRTLVITVATASLVMGGVCFALRYNTTEWNSFDEYFLRAIRMVRDGRFASGDLPGVLFPPGYSFLLMPAVLLLGVTRWTFFITNLALLLGAAIGFRAILMKAGVALRSANLFSLLVAVYPNHLFSLLTPMSDVPFSLAALLAFSFLMLYGIFPDRRVFLVASGLSAGAMCLIRGNGLMLLPALALGFLLISAPTLWTRLFRGIAVVGLALLVILPWTIRNYGVTGKFIPVSANVGINIAIGNNPYQLTGWNRYVDSLCTTAGGPGSVINGEWNEAQRDSVLLHMGWSFIAGHPTATAWLALTKVASALKADTYSFGILSTYTNLPYLTLSRVVDEQLPAKANVAGHMVYQTMIRSAIVTTNLLYYLLLATGAGILLRRDAMPRHMRGAVLVAVCAVALMIGLTFDQSRYKEPLSTVLILVAAQSFIPPGRKRTSVVIPAHVMMPAEIPVTHQDA